jgi:hypothetical protein
MKVSVHYWRFEDGSGSGRSESSYPPDPLPRGWYCWAYTRDHEDFEEWMDRFCPTAEHTRRFNNGNPMHTVYIADDQEATVFQLKWL